MRSGRNAAASGRIIAASRPASTSRVGRQPIVSMPSWAAGADTARAPPLPDCRTEIAAPRRRSNRRDSNGTNTSRPRQLAPTVMTTPYSSDELPQRGDLRGCDQADDQQGGADQHHAARAEAIDHDADRGALTPLTSWDTA